ncbi:hypothetical protein OG320_14390 [Microbispora sp. NBC_01189]|uniref:hypothetical protein n=1 Tax=Microbispora sp. NBC_01189 TaxID=2903583 RepID=UPI002E0E5B5A|nr:hypothetical protein OG320_14390 [Microbispora sp. NBC_01189]
MARHVAAEATKRGGCLLPLLTFVAVAGAIVYGINDPVGAAHAVKAAFRTLATFTEALTTD